MVSDTRAFSRVETRETDGRSGSGGLLGTRYKTLASNTIDYWMLSDYPTMAEARVLKAIEEAPVFEESSLQIYLHVPFCAQRCRFCAFSGGNSLSFSEAERYSRLVVLQIQDLLNRTRIKGQPIRSINIGGGSPDLLGKHIGHVLGRMRDLPGCTDATEFSVEFTLSTTKPEFIEELVRHGVTKASFGVQSVDRQVRQFMGQPRSLTHLDKVLKWIDGRIPVVNADLITGLPGQTLRTVQSDLRTMMDESRVNCISSYLLTPGAAPSLLAGLVSEEIPQLPEPHEQALMRLTSYDMFRREGWMRRGTNTYVDPKRVAGDIINKIAGNECIGTSHYEAFLLSAGPQAVSYLPGVRVENCVDIHGWTKAMERGEHPFHLPKCADVHQRDAALWVFPLRWESLPQSRFDRMREQGGMSDEQLTTLAELESEGLVVHTPKGFELSILGEVFMGHLVHDLKNVEGQRAVDDYIAEGYALGRAIAGGGVRDTNSVNNRQIALPLIQGQLPADDR